MADLYNDAFELMRSIKNRRKRLEYRPSLADYYYRFKQTGPNSFAISHRYLRLASAENGLVSCQGYYHNGGCYTYDPPPFYQLRQELSRRGFISLSTSEHQSYDVVVAMFVLNGRRFYAGDKFQSAVWHARREYP